MDENKCVSLDEYTTGKLLEVGQMVADERPDLNGKLSDEVLVRAGVFALHMMLTMKGWDVGKVLMASLTAAIDPSILD